MQIENEYNNELEQLRSGSKKPPSAVEVEQAVLGSMILQNECIPKVSEILKPERFFDKKNNIVFKAILDLFNSGEPVDTVTLYNYLNNSGEIESIGGAAYVSKLSQDISSSANVDYHAKIVLEKWIQRKLITTSNEVASLAYSNNDVFDTVALAEQKFFEIMHSIEVSEVETSDKLVQKSLEMVDLINSGKYENFYVKTGFRDFDKRFDGLFNSDLTILAARPGVGKTTLALNITKNVAFNKKVLFYSYEMPSIQLINKLISSECGIPAKDIRMGRIPKDKAPAYSRACTKIGNRGILVNDKNPSFFELKNNSRKINREEDLGLIVVDYLQLMHGEKEQSREREVAVISRGLKSLAKELDVPILALSQLNRDVEGRASKRPNLADLRESGAIEQDADNVIFIHRPETKGMESFTDGYFKGQSCIGVAEIITEKSRNDEPASILLGFDGSSSNFRDLEVRHNDDFPEDYFNN